MATLRARDEGQKLARKHTLMDAGWSLFLESDGNLPSVAQVVKKAGLAKGTFYLYFKTKEELFLALLSDAVERFFDKIKDELSTPSINVDSLIDTFVKQISEDQALTRLGCIMSGVIEQNTEENVLLHFKLKMVQMLFDVGEMISVAVENAIKEGKPYNHIDKGTAARLVLRSYAAFVGVAQMAPAPNNIGYDAPEFSPVKLDIQADTKAIMRALWQEAILACDSKPQF
ncbi:MAG: hypothetical protein CSA49_07310 [Gammaproteobacteria bacterium]|nr:MAG: hypothetical protein CSA49_07310 [Gammaproteobacteria bacterium]